MAATTIIGALAGLGGAAASGAFSSHSAPPPPAMLNEPPPIMPTADSDAVNKEKRRSLLTQMARRGRESTFLTPDVGDTLG